MAAPLECPRGIHGQAHRVTPRFAPGTDVGSQLGDGRGDTTLTAPGASSGGRALSSGPRGHGLEIGHDAGGPAQLPEQGLAGPAPRHVSRHRQTVDIFVDFTDLGRPFRARDTQSAGDPVERICCASHQPADLVIAGAVVGLLRQGFRGHGRVLRQRGQRAADPFRLLEKVKERQPQREWDVHGFVFHCAGSHVSRALFQQPRRNIFPGQRCDERHRRHDDVD